METKTTNWDQLLLEGLLLIIALGALLAGVLGGLEVFTTDRLTAAVSLGDATQLAESGGYALQARDATLLITDPTVGQRLWAFAPVLLAALTVGIVSTLLLGVVRSMRTGDPFHRRNARLLTISAVVALVGGSVAALAQVLSSISLAADAPNAFDLPVGGTFTLMPFAVGIVLAAVAGVFRRGTTLREELEGVI